MRRQLLRDSATYLIGSLIVQILGFIGMIFLMRFLPIAEYGKYNYVIEFIAIFAFFADGGFTQRVIKDISQNSTSVETTYLRAQSAQVLISGLMLILILITSYPFNTLEDFYYLTLYGLSVVVSGYFAPMLAILIASGRKDLIFFKDVSMSVIKIVFILLGIYFKAPLLYFVGLGFINCLVLLSLFLYLRSQKAFEYLSRLKLDISGSFDFIKSGLLFTLLMASNIIYSKIDVIMLEKMIGSVEVGYYAGATRFIYPFMFISTAFMTAIFPKLAKYAGDKDRFKSVQQLGLYTLGGLGILLSSTLFFGADFIFDLFFGDKYNSSIPTFKVLVWFLAIVFIYGPISNSLVAKNKVRFVVILNALMILVNVLVNFSLIPMYGAKGAAIATIACEIIVLMCTLLYWRRISKE